MSNKKAIRRLEKKLAVLTDYVFELEEDIETVATELAATQENVRRLRSFTSPIGRPSTFPQGFEPFKITSEGIDSVVKTAGSIFDMSSKLFKTPWRDPSNED